MSRLWLARITLGVLFLAAMAGVRLMLIALRDTHDTVLIATVCLPLIIFGIALAFWIDRKGH